MDSTPLPSPQSHLQAIVQGPCSGGPLLLVPFQLLQLLNLPLTAKSRKWALKLGKSPNHCCEIFQPWEKKTEGSWQKFDDLKDGSIVSKLP